MPQKELYYANGGILQYVLRQLPTGKPEAVGVQGNRRGLVCLAELFAWQAPGDQLRCSP
jgi:hypothetical protein